MIRLHTERLFSRFLNTTRAVAAAALLALGALSGCSTSPSDEMEDGQIAELPPQSFVVEWRADVPVTSRITRLHASGDKLFVQTADRRMLWLNRSSGRLISVTPVAKGQDAVYPPVVLPDRVVIPLTTELRVYTPDGDPMHVNRLVEPITSAAAGAGLELFAGMDHLHGGRVAALGLNPQPYRISPRWQFMTRGRVTAAPVLLRESEDERDLLLFAGSRDGRVYAVRAYDRSMLWDELEIGAFQTGSEILADVKADAEGVYVASTDSKLYCLDKYEGRVRWMYYASASLTAASTPIVMPDVVYLYVPGRGIAAVPKAGSSHLRQEDWIVQEGRQFLASDRRFVYLATGDGGIIAVNKDSGQVEFSSRRSDFRAFATNTDPDDSTIYAATADGRVYAIRSVLTTGTVGQWVLRERPVEPVAIGR